jgi:hypothetical protein
MKQPIEKPELRVMTINPKRKRPLRELDHRVTPNAAVWMYNTDLDQATLARERYM